MPVHIRKFLLKETQDLKNEEAKQMKEAQKGKGSSGKIARPPKYNGARARSPKV